MLENLQFELQTYYSIIAEETLVKYETFMPTGTAICKSAARNLKVLFIISCSNVKNGVLDVVHWIELKDLAAYDISYLRPSSKS